MKKLLFPLIALFAISALVGCGEKPVDPVKANEGQGQSMDVPGRAGRSETKALEDLEKK